MSTVRVRLAGASWVVECSSCSGEGLPFDLFGAGKCWMRATKDAYAQALWWANWHAAEHRRTRCEPCGRDHPIPKFTILDDNTVRVGDRLFLRRGSGWKEAL